MVPPPPVACRSRLSTLTRSVVAVCRSRTSTSVVPLVSPGTRLDANDQNATKRPSALMAASTEKSSPAVPGAADADPLGGPRRVGQGSRRTQQRQQQRRQGRQDQAPWTREPRVTEGTGRGQRPMGGGGGGHGDLLETTSQQHKHVRTHDRTHDRRQPVNQRIGRPIPRRQAGLSVIDG